jgi:murein DD-endopeptidase MepM/ murein hydrolase activator NlpD
LLAGVEYSVPQYSRTNNVYIAGRDAYVPTQKTYKQTGGGKLAWPVRGIITQGYYSYHRAIDIANKTGTTIYAAEGGTISLVSTGSYGHGYGNYIIVNHGNGLQTLYAHLHKVYVREGQTVARGESIGEMGNTGRSTGPHLHFEVRDGKVKGNPYTYFK